MSDAYGKYKIEKTNFDTILNESDSVEIPIFQRDYAQGRSSANEILEGFLNDIFTHLRENKALKLSFVYGEKRPVDDNKFVYIPYDGQQRLTLIYLLSLYFASFSGEWEYITKLSKFKYKTRDNAIEFCRFLTSFDKKRSDECNNIFKRIDFFDSKDLDEQITMDIDFIDSWIYDPTVKSMLIVLKKIHKKYTEINQHNHQSIVVEQAKKYFDEIKNGILFFDWCTIQASDEIYVKMNGRGKPLTAFDNFKNTLFSELKKMRKKDGESKRQDRIEFLNDFEGKMEGSWTSLFWSERSNFEPDENKNYNIAPVMMNFLFYVFELRNQLSEETLRRDIFYFGSSNSFCLINEKNVISFLAMFNEKCKDGLITLDDYIWLSKILDIINNNIDKDEYLKKLFIELYSEKRNDAMDLRTTIEAAIYFEYLVRVSEFNSNGDYISINLESKNEWCKLITRIMDTASVFKGRYDALVRDRHIICNINKYFIDIVFQNNTAGSLSKTAKLFDGNNIEVLKMPLDRSHVFSQFKEELFKLALIEEDKEWNKIISDAEQRLTYFNNQIFFLFELSRNSSGEISKKAFDKYVEVLDELTNANGIKNTYENKFTAILLSIKDYRIRCEEGKSNALSLCSNNASDFFTWRHLFDILSNEEVGLVDALKTAFDKIIENDISINQTYQAIKKINVPEKWREIIIKYPNILKEVNDYRIVYYDDKNNINKWYLINSGATKQVRRYSLLQSINIEMYGMCREAKVSDIVIEGQNNILPNDIIITNEIETDKYQLDGKKYRLKDYDKIVDNLKKAIKG